MLKLEEIRDQNHPPRQPLSSLFVELDAKFLQLPSDVVWDRRS